MYKTNYILKAFRCFHKKCKKVVDCFVCKGYLQSVLIFASMAKRGSLLKLGKIDFDSSKGHEIALKYWKRIFLSDKTSRGERDLFLGDLFEDDDDEIVEYVAGEIDRIHGEIKEREKEEPRAYGTPWYSWNISTLNKIRDRCGYSGLRRLPVRVKDPYAVEGVMTYLVGAAKKEGVPKSHILSMEEYLKLSKEIKWHLIKDYED